MDVKADRYPNVDRVMSFRTITGLLNQNEIMVGIQSVTGKCVLLSFSEAKDEPDPGVVHAPCAILLLVAPS